MPHSRSHATSSPTRPMAMAARLALASALALALTLAPPSPGAQAPAPTPTPLPATAPSPAPAPAFDVAAHYTKREVMIPMRDGARLFTIVYEPRDRSTAWPIMITRTAYGIAPYGPDAYRNFVGPSVEFSKEGYIFVYQDTRGKFRSEGEFIHHVPYVKGAGPNESTDTWDTIDWLLKNVPNHNGRVGQWGISWAGWEVSQGMLDAHPAIKASSPQAPPQDQFFGDDYHSGGAYQLAYGFNWLTTNARARTGPNEADAKRFEFPTPDGYRFFLDLGAAANASKYFDGDIPTWNDHMSHGTYDAYWQSRNIPKDLVNIHHAVLIVAGWFDAEDFYGPFRMYRGIEEKNRPNNSVLVVGPWYHGAWARSDGASLGAISFGSNTGDFFRTQVELPFFNHYLKDKGKADLPEALMFETGVNQWHRFDQWPPAGATNRPLYLRAGGKLSFDPPTDKDAADAWVNDPARPVPYTAEILTRESQRFVVEDQRFAATRPDVLVYESDVLTEDVTVAGPVMANLTVSTTGTDGDWVVKLIDVYPDNAPDGMGGYQMLLAGDLLRARFRNSFTTPEPMVPGKATPLSFTVGDRFHTFRKGHRIMVQVQGSWFPMFDRNPQSFVDIYHAKPADYRVATQRIIRTRDQPSHLLLPVLAR